MDRANPIPDDRSRYNQFTALSLRNKNRLRALVDSLNPDATGASASTLSAARMHSACMDEAAIEKEGFPSDLKNLMDMISFDGADNEWTHADATTLADILSELRLGGVGQSALFFAVGTDDKNSSQHAMFMGQSGITLPDRDYYLKDDPSNPKLVAYRKYIGKCFNFLGTLPTKMQVPPSQII